MLKSLEVVFTLSAKIIAFDQGESFKANCQIHTFAAERCVQRQEWPCLG